MSTPSLLTLSPSGRKYGALKDQHDPRDHTLPTALQAPVLPQAADLRPWCGPIKNQGQEGSCTGHTGSSSVEWQFRRYKSASPVLSPQFLYIQELIKDGNFPNDVGAGPRTMCQVLNQIGVCEEGLDPYVAGRIAKPSDAVVASAQQFRLGAYHRLNGVLDLLSVLGHPTPWPVLVSFWVYASFETTETAATGIMPIPDVKNEEFLGGHEVLAVGYDSSRQMVICQNSWGENWGMDGFFEMPYRVVSDPNLCSDLWVIHLGHWA